MGRASVHGKYCRTTASTCFPNTFSPCGNSFFLIPEFLFGRNEKGASEMNIPPISQLDLENIHLYCKVKGPGEKNTLSLTSDLTPRPGPRNEQPNPDLTPGSEKSLSLLLHSASMAKQCFLLYHTFQLCSLLPKPYRSCLLCLSLCCLSLTQRQLPFCSSPR